MRSYTKYTGNRLQKPNGGGISQAFLTIRVHYHTIGQVGKHMEKQPNADDVERFGEKKEYNVYDHRIVGMQWMVINTAPIGLKNRISHQMIQIYQHGRKQDKIDLFPIVSKKTIGDKKRETQV